jgi:phage-related baseplate assembly protein
VTVTCLAEDKASPAPPIQDLLLVQARMADTDIVPLTDVVAVQPPDVIHLAYVVNLYLLPNADQATVTARVQAALAALAESQRWLGADHTRMAISGACRVAGVQNADIVSPPQDVAVSDMQVGVVDSITVSVVGRRT